MKTNITGPMSQLSIRSDVCSALASKKKTENSTCEEDKRKKTFKFLKLKTKLNQSQARCLLDDETEEMYDTQTSTSSITNTYYETDDDDWHNPNLALFKDKIPETSSQIESSEIWFPAFGETTPPAANETIVRTSRSSRNNIHDDNSNDFPPKTQSLNIEVFKKEGNESHLKQDNNERGDHIISPSKRLNSVTDLKWRCDSRNMQGKYRGEVLKTSAGRIAHGKGKLLLSNGDIYIGPFKNGMMHGSNATYKSKLGGEYYGSYHDNFKHGFGEQLFINGNRYVGQYYDDLPNGVGVKYDKSGSIIHHGEWVDGTPIQGSQSKSASGPFLTANGLLSVASSNGMRLVIPPNFQPSTRSLDKKNIKAVPLATDAFVRNATTDNDLQKASSKSRKGKKIRSDSSVATYEVSIYDPKHERLMGLI